MRMMSFAMTTEQYKNGTKDVTRRFGWWFLKPDDIFMGVEKAMGIPKGEKVVKLGPSIVISTRKEPLYHITKADCIREGFPDFTPDDFVEMLVKHYKCKDTDMCNRIEFKRTP